VSGAAVATGWSGAEHYVGIPFFVVASRRRHTRSKRDWSSDVCSSDLRLNHELGAVLNKFNTEEAGQTNEYYEAVMNGIPYLEAVIKETLRKYPSVTQLTRHVGVDNYKLNGIKLFKNQQVEIPVSAVHHCEDYYPEPDRFNPERFMPENKHLLVPYTYLPFGLGPRNCVGVRFAYQEIKLCLASIVQRF